MTYNVFGGTLSLTQSINLSKNNEASAAGIPPGWPTYLRGAAMASAVARAYNGGLRAEPQAGVQGQSPRWGVSGEPPEADEVFVYKPVIFNASAAVFHEMMYCLSGFFCAQIYGFTVRICSLATKLEQNGLTKFILTSFRTHASQLHWHI